MKWSLYLTLFLTGCGNAVHGDRHDAQDFVEGTMAALQRAGTPPREDYASNEVFAMALLQRPCMQGSFEILYVDEIFYDYMFNVTFPASGVGLSVFAYKRWPWSGFRITGVEFAGQDEFSRQALRECLGEERFMDWMKRRTEKYLPGNVG